MFSEEILDLAKQVLGNCRATGFKLATAESCTGGLIAGSLTEIAGSSDVVDRGFVTYTNEAKHQMLGVPDELFQSVGAVSEEVARAMAEGAVQNSDSSIAISVTGIAGPGGATDTKPVGLVHMAVAKQGAATRHQRHVFAGNRSEVRVATVAAGLMLINKVLEE